MAVVQAGSCSSNLTPSPGTCICRRCGPNKKKKKIYIYQRQATVWEKILQNKCLQRNIYPAYVRNAYATQQKC